MIKTNPTDEKFFRISDILKEEQKKKKSDEKSNTENSPNIRR